MSTINSLIPRQPVPALEVPTVGGTGWRLADQKPETFTLVVFYRGLHCPICANVKVSGFWSEWALAHC